MMQFRINKAVSQEIFLLYFIPEIFTWEVLFYFCIMSQGRGLLEISQM